MPVLIPSGAFPDALRFRRPLREELLTIWELRFIEGGSGDGEKFADIAERRPDVVYTKTIEPLANHRTQGYPSQDSTSTKAEVR